MRDRLSSDHTAAVSASEYSELASERRDTERAVTLWHQKAAELGWPPPLEAFDLSRMTSDWAYRFVICGEDVEHSVFLLYGTQLARLLGLPEKANYCDPMIVQLPEPYRPLFAEGCGEVITASAPARFSGAIEHHGRTEYYRAAFLPVKLRVGALRPIVFGSFNCRAVPGIGPDGLRKIRSRSPGLNP
jgi:hypothetical protein